MIAILGSLLGFFSSSIPHILQLFQDKADKAQELAILQIQMQMQQLQLKGQLEEVRESNQLLQEQSLYQTYKVGVGWVDALNGTVRPVLSYCFFILYAVVKFMQFYSLGPTADVDAHITVLWTDNDNVIF